MIKKLGSTSIPKALLVKVINNLSDFFNVNNSMNAAQVAITVNFLLEEYAVLKLDDFKLCFNRAMKGHYAKDGKTLLYGRLDGELIFEWVEMFLEEKAIEIEEYRRNESKRFQKAEATPVLDPEKQPISKPEWFTLPEKKVAVIASNEAKVRTPEQEMFQGFIRQFDQRWLLRKVTKDKTGRSIGGRWVYKYGKILNAEGYLAYKADQLFKVKKYLQNRKSR